MDQKSIEGAQRRIVDLSVHFAKIYDSISANDADFIDEFIEHVEQHGFVGLPGRLKESWDIPTQDPFYAKKSQYAKKWNLWHYHLGMPGYETSKGHGNYTSEWILHLILRPCGLRATIVDWDSHPPFELPPEHRFIMPQDLE